MAHRSRWVLLTLCAAGAYAGNAAAEPPREAVTIRTYNVAGATSAVSTVAETVAGALMRDAGIEVAWRRCRTTSGPTSHSADTCADVLKPREIAIRMVNAPPTIIELDTLGYSHVDVSLRRGTLATVFVDRIHIMAFAIRMNDGELLGRAIAHEIGHLLLGTSRHSETGLMRGHWSGRGQEEDWKFTEGESAQMRLAVAALSPDGVVAALR